MIYMAWILFATGAVWFISERKKSSERKPSAFTLIVPFVSWFVFYVIHKGVIASKGTEIDALLAGALFGSIVLAVCIFIKWLVTKRKRVSEEV